MYGDVTNVQFIAMLEKERTDENSKKVVIEEIISKAKGDSQGRRLCPMPRLLSEFII